MSIQSVNPTTGEVIERFDEYDDDRIEEAVARAFAAFETGRSVSLELRSEKMEATARVLDDGKHRWARIATEEMGKTFVSALAEVEKCAWVCRYYAQHAREFLADEPIESDADRSFVRHLPLGPILAVMPWNFPYWQVFRFAAPGLMAGNTCLLKHASNVPRCALAIEEMFDRSGWPKGVFQSLLISSDPVGALLADDRIRGVTLTGSERAGSAVASQAGDQIKPALLELGGSDPFLVMPSAPLDEAARAAVTGRTINNGQSCIAAKRFIVHGAVYDAFTALLVERFGELSVGDPMKESTDIGPLAMEQIRQDVDEQVRKSVEKGAGRLIGAEVMPGDGFFYRPGVLAEIPEGAPAYREEVFGPVALLFRATDLDHAIEIANTTSFGLGSSIWTKERGEAERAIDRLEAGATFVNSIVASDPRLPFGGVRRSGFGRELSRDGIRAFVNRKTVSVKH